MHRIMAFRRGRQDQRFGSVSFIVDWAPTPSRLAPGCRQLALPKTGRDGMGNDNVRIDSLELKGAKFAGLTAAVDPFFAGKEGTGSRPQRVRRASRDARLSAWRRAPRKGSLPAADDRILAIGTGEGERGPMIDISIGGLKVRALLDTGLPSGWPCRRGCCRTCRSRPAR
jgi:hypothetical protein